MAKKLFVILATGIIFISFAGVAYAGPPDGAPIPPIGGAAPAPAPLCDQSGDGITPGTAYNIGFRNGLVPCGNNGQYQYTVQPITNIDVRNLTNDTWQIFLSILRSLGTYPNIINACAGSLQQCQNAINSNGPAIIDGIQGWANNALAARANIINAYHLNGTVGSTTENGAKILVQGMYPAAQLRLAEIRVREITPFCRCELSHVWILILNLYRFCIWYIGLPIAGLMIVIGGVLMVLSGINANWYTRGKDIIKWTIIAFLLMLASWLIIDAVLHAIGYSGAVSWWAIPLR